MSPSSYCFLLLLLVHFKILTELMSNISCHFVVDQNILLCIIHSCTDSQFSFVGHCARYANSMLMSLLLCIMIL